MARPVAPAPVPPQQPAPQAPPVQPAYEQPVRRPEPQQPVQPQPIVFELDGNVQQHAYNAREEENMATREREAAKRQSEERELMQRRAEERRERLRMLSSEVTTEAIKEKLDTPAYLRRNVALDRVSHSSERNISRFNLNDDNEILGDNRFLHDNVD